MSSNKIMISIVLGTYNQLETLKIVLSEYEKQTINTELFEVIVVDSTSTDGSVEFFSQYKPRFNFRFHSQENKGKAAARNKRGIFGTRRLYYNYRCGYDSRKKPL